MPRRSDSDTDTPDGDAGQAEVQARFDEAADKGYFGTTPDPTPNENYTLAGVTSGAPTPETDDGLAAEARAAVFGTNRRR